MAGRTILLPRLLSKNGMLGEGATFVSGDHRLQVLCSEEGRNVLRPFTACLLCRHPVSGGKREGCTAWVAICSLKESALCDYGS